ncbi:unnamed protein product [Amaranthus hypochondriacus]
MNMISTKTFLLNTLFITNLYLSTSVNGDAVLISHVCTKTPNPKDCHQCLDSAAALELTVRELAADAMYCTYNTSTSLNQKFTDLASKGNITITSTYTLCSSRIDEFGKKLLKAMTSLYQRDYEFAKKELNSADFDYQNCSIALQKLTSPVPVDVNSLLKIVNSLYRISSNIMLQSEEN